MEREIQLNLTMSEWCKFWSSTTNRELKKFTCNVVAAKFKLDRCICTSLFYYKVCKGSDMFY